MMVVSKDFYNCSASVERIASDLSRVGNRNSSTVLLRSNFWSYICFFFVTKVLDQ